jgi:hypothetical protein
MLVSVEIAAVLSKSNFQISTKSILALLECSQKDGFGKLYGPSADVSL